MDQHYKIDNQALTIFLKEFIAISASRPLHDMTERSVILGTFRIAVKEASDKLSPEEKLALLFAILDIEEGR